MSGSRVSLLTQVVVLVLLLLLLLVALALALGIRYCRRRRRQRASKVSAAWALLSPFRPSQLPIRSFVLFYCVLSCSYLIRVCFVQSRVVASLDTSTNYECAYNVQLREQFHALPQPSCTLSSHVAVGALHCSRLVFLTSRPRDLSTSLVRHTHSSPMRPHIFSHAYVVRCSLLWCSTDCRFSYCISISSENHLIFTRTSYSSCTGRTTECPSLGVAHTKRRGEARRGEASGGYLLVGS